MKGGNAKEIQKGSESHGPQDGKGAINDVVCENGKSMQLQSYTSEVGKQETAVR